jgi:transposase
MEVRRKVRSVWAGLSRRERRILRSHAKGSPDAVLRGRAKIVLSLVRGNRPSDVAKAGLGSASQVYRVANRFVEQGPPGLADQREDNGDAKVTEEYQGCLLVAVSGSPRDFGHRRPTWTQELLVEVLAAHTGTRISRTVMSRLLKAMGARLGRPKPIVGCPWKTARRQRRLRAIRRLIDRLPKNEVVLYVDEVDIHLNPKIGPDWMLRGVQKQVLTPGQNEKRYLAGALDARSGRVIWVEAERKDSNLFIALLWKLIREYPRAKRIHIVLDNFKIHSSRQTQLALASVGDRMTLHFLPPYCPDHNRIERVWKDLHDNVTRNHNCGTMPQLMAEVRHWLRRRNAQTNRNAA